MCVRVSRWNICGRPLGCVRVRMCTSARAHACFSLHALVRVCARGCTQTSQVMEHKHACLAYDIDTRVATSDACPCALPVHPRVCVCACARVHTRASVCAHPTVPVSRRTPTCPSRSRPRPARAAPPPRPRARCGRRNGAASTCGRSRSRTRRPARAVGATVRVGTCVRARVYVRKCACVC
jgi:hypothetical protein